VRYQDSLLGSESVPREFPSSLSAASVRGQKKKKDNDVADAHGDGVALLPLTDKL